jgi:hypothetical protein
LAAVAIAHPRSGYRSGVACGVPNACLCDQVEDSFEISAQRLHHAMREWLDLRYIDTERYERRSWQNCRRAVGPWMRLSSDRCSAGPPCNPKRAPRHARRQRLLGGTPIGRRFETNPVFDFYAATIMTLVALGYDFAGFDDLRAPAIGTTPKFDQRRRTRPGHFAFAFSLISWRSSESFA